MKLHLIQFNYSNLVIDPDSDSKNNNDDDDDNNNEW